MAPQGTGRFLLGIAVLVLAALALLPLLSLFQFSWFDLASTAMPLGASGRIQLLNTAALLLAVCSLSALLGTANGWLTANCRFPGSRWLRIAQLLPLASPAYLLAATLIDLGSRHSWRIHGLPWAITVLMLTTYPYVFLLSTESFAVSGRRQLEACRSLGVGPWGSFRRVALPMAIPAIGAGVALTGMEVVNELGAVELLGVPTLSSGILQRWQNEGDPQGAVALALVALAIVVVLVAAERWLRRRSRRWLISGGGDAQPPWQLSGGRAAAAQLIALLPPLLSLGLPLLWVTLSLDQLQSEPAAELLLLGGRTLALGLVAAGLTLVVALLLAVAKRWIAQPLVQRLSFLAGMGYAMPGTVLALALMLLGGPWPWPRADWMPGWSGSAPVWMRPPQDWVAAGPRCWVGCMCRC
jgi:iron(III) transport system permease protein